MLVPLEEEEVAPEEEAEEAEIEEDDRLEFRFAYNLLSRLLHDITMKAIISIYYISVYSYI